MPYETLHELVTQERDEILQRWAVVARCVPELDKSSQGELWDHLPLFLDDLASLLDALAPRQPVVAPGAVPIAEIRGVGFAVSHEGDVELVGDRRLVFSAISNLVRTAVKFTAPGGTVSVRRLLDDDEVVIEVEDQCGGLPPGKSDELFQPFVQRSSDRTGFGLGLPIARHAILAHGGSLSVRDLPSRGCIFTIRLPLEPTPRIGDGGDKVGE